MRRRLLHIGLILLLAEACERQGGGPYQLVILNGTLIDGTGAPGRPADIGVRNGHIVAIAPNLDDAPADRVIDATGLTVAPGFIDLHAHLDPLLRLPGAESHIRQGVTTALGGPDGGAPWPLAAYLDSAAALGLGMNVAFLTGHNTIRQEVMGLANRAPTADELERMKAMVAQAMDEGAFGLSTGLRYLPGAFAKTDEVIELARMAAERGGIYTSHLRDEGMQLMEGVGEAIEIGRQAGIPVVLTHHKVVGKPMWGASERTLAMIDSARAAGIDVMADQYPYTASHSGIGILVPAWAMAGGDSAFERRLQNRALRDSLVRGIIWNIENDRGGGDISRVQFARVRWDASLEGKTLADWAAREGLPPTAETGANLIITALTRGGANGIYHVMDEGDVERIMKHPFTAIASDGRLVELGDGHPHPRWYGTFPRVLGHYARDRGVITLEEAVRKMTSLPADRLGLEDRGRIRENAWADIVVFDATTVADMATFEEPHQYPVGIPYVIVNGVLVVDSGRASPARPGQVLRHAALPARERTASAAPDVCALVLADVYERAMMKRLGQPEPQPDGGCVYPARDNTSGASLRLTVRAEPGFTPAADYFSSRADSLRGINGEAMDFVSDAGTAGIWRPDEKILEFVLPGYRIILQPGDYRPNAVLASPLDIERARSLAAGIQARLRR
jgi:dihydroorotase/N-acyl-D-amino-acid deacylase